MNSLAKIIGVVLFCLLSIVSAYSQEKIKTVDEIRTLISQDSIEKAKAIATKNIELYKSQKQYDSLTEYIRFEGHFKFHNGNTQAAIIKAKKLTEYITTTNDPHLIKKAITQMGYIYDNAGQTERAYDVLLQAVEPTS
ncbi:MAG TPA: hypothetical protein VFD80_06840, partial [Flavobacteriaceae bacterium]|nr:hypothetical protein [Flavobacteriaceae bacterium]